MEGYPLCRIEAFVESITHLEHVADRKRIVQEFIAAQASGKDVKEFVTGIKVKKEKHDAYAGEAEDFLKEFNLGFKGLD